MLEKYAKFLEKFDKRLSEYFSEHRENIKCKEGCTTCCEVGEYPFSRLEMEYAMKKFLTLPKEMKMHIRKEIQLLKAEKVIYHKCPFLINKSCSIYPNRGVVCRTHGLAWFDKDAGRIKLPYCVNKGLNYSSVYDRKTQAVYLDNPIKENFKIDYILRNSDAEELGLECGEIRPILDWF